MTFTSRPLPHERCACGAEMFISTQSIEGRERERASFRDAHAQCRQPDATLRRAARAVIAEHDRIGEHISSRPMDLAIATLREILDA